MVGWQELSAYHSSSSRCVGQQRQLQANSASHNLVQQHNDICLLLFVGASPAFLKGDARSCWPLVEEQCYLLRPFCPLAATYLDEEAVRRSVWVLVFSPP